MNCLAYLRYALVGPSGLEPPTSRLSAECSSQLSYKPIMQNPVARILIFGAFGLNFEETLFYKKQSFVSYLLTYATLSLVEMVGVEPMTSCLQGRRSPN